MSKSISKNFTDFTILDEFIQVLIDWENGDSLDDYYQKMTPFRGQNDESWDIIVAILYVLNKMSRAQETGEIEGTRKMTKEESERDKKIVSSQRKRANLSIDGLDEYYAENTYE